MLGIVTVAFIGYRYYASKTVTESNDAPYQRNIASQQEIRGFRFDGFHDGKKVITIKADRFSIEKKKVGFFRFGLMSEARLENAVIRIYGEEKQKSAKQAGHSARYGENVTFEHVLSKDALPPMKQKRISSVFMAPVQVVLLKGNSTLSTISAASATIRLRKRDVLFRGKVRLASGNRELTTDKLRLLPEKGAVQCDYHFQLMASGKKRTGNHLTTDIFLN